MEPLQTAQLTFCAAISFSAKFLMISQVSRGPVLDILGKKY